jgi:hypothetical protein
MLNDSVSELKIGPDSNLASSTAKLVFVWCVLIRELSINALMFCHTHEDKEK